MSAAEGFPNGGIMGERVRHHDWASTSLGPIATWPESLKGLVNLVLAAPLPMNLLWGPELIQIYNDAYAPIMGLKHPAGLGQPAAECWHGGLGGRRAALRACVRGRDGGPGKQPMDLEQAWRSGSRMVRQLSHPGPR